MGKVITSPVKRWPGTVTLADPFTHEQFFAWRDAVQAAQAHKDDFPRYLAALVPGIAAVVEAWQLERFAPPPAPFPATPVQASNELLVWLVAEIRKVVNGEDDDPK